MKVCYIVRILSNCLSRKNLGVPLARPGRQRFFREIARTMNRDRPIRVGHPNGHLWNFFWSLICQNVKLNININVIEHTLECWRFPRYINNELEEGRPVSSKSVYPRNSVLDSEFGHKV